MSRIPKRHIPPAVKFLSSPPVNDVYRALQEAIARQDANPSRSNIAAVQAIAMVFRQLSEAESTCNAT